VIHKARSSGPNYARRLLALGGLFGMVLGLVWLLLRSAGNQPLQEADLPSPTPEQSQPTLTLPEPFLQRLSLVQAEESVRTWYLEAHPNMNPTAQMPLQEMTTPEIWDSMGLQIFKTTGGPVQYETFLIQDGSVQQIGFGFGGMGVTSLLVNDADDDGQPDLLYTYSWGSGMGRSQLGLYSTGLPEPLVWAYSLFQADLYLKDAPENQAELWAGLPDGRQIAIGSVQMKQGRSGLFLDVSSMDGFFPSELSDLLVKTLP
jgi:hypothetical protein